MAMTVPPIEYLFVTLDYLVSIDDAVTAYGASTRLGCIAPSRALMDLGYDARTVSAAGDAARARQAVPAAKRVVFSEMPETKEGWAAPAAAYRSLLQLIPSRRGRVVFSIADDHFDDALFREFYAEVLPDCLAVTTVSQSLAERVRALTSRPVLIAPEPCEGARGAPHAFAARIPGGPFAWLARRIGLTSDLWRTRLLWFGYPSNLPPLISLLPALEQVARSHPLLLTCVTNPVIELESLLTPARTRDTSPLRVQFVPWSPTVMGAMMVASDLVLIPSDYRNPVKQAKSPNRLVAGLQGGRFVIAHPLPAYAPYADFAWIGEDLAAGVRWAIRNPRKVLDRIARGQAYIDERHSPEAVARFWLDVLHPKN
jgi:hypothetical protein